MMRKNLCGKVAIVTGAAERLAADGAHEVIAERIKNRGLPGVEAIGKVMLEPAAIERPLEPSAGADFVAYPCPPAAGLITGAALAMDLGRTAK